MTTLQYYKYRNKNYDGTHGRWWISVIDWKGFFDKLKPKTIYKLIKFGKKNFLFYREYKIDTWCVDC